MAYTALEYRWRGGIRSFWIDFNGDNVAHSGLSYVSEFYRNYWNQLGVNLVRVHDSLPMDVLTVVQIAIARGVRSPRCQDGSKSNQPGCKQKLFVSITPVRV